MNVKVGKKMMRIRNKITHQRGKGIRKIDHALPMSDIHTYREYDSCQPNSNIDKQIFQPETQPKMNGRYSQYRNKRFDNVTGNLRLDGMI